MTKAQALKLARAKWGDRAVTAERTMVPTVAERTAAEARLAQWWEQDRENRSSAERERLERIVSALRCRVGFADGMSTKIVGEGDSWEEACRKAGLIP
jgi:hypothetical protein